MAETFRVIAKCSFFEFNRGNLSEEECYKLLKHLKNVKEDMALLIANVYETKYRDYSYRRIWNMPRKMNKQHLGYRLHLPDFPLDIEIISEQKN